MPYSLMNSFFSILPIFRLGSLSLSKSELFPVKAEKFTEKSFDFDGFCTDVLWVRLDDLIEDSAAIVKSLFLSWNVMK